MKVEIGLIEQNLNISVKVKVLNSEFIIKEIAACLFKRELFRCWIFYVGQTTVIFS